MPVTIEAPDDPLATPAQPTPRAWPSSGRGRKRCIEDYARVMDLAGYRDTLSRDRDTLIKLNLSWTKYFPSCSSQPWQVDGVLDKMLADGFRARAPDPDREQDRRHQPARGMPQQPLGAGAAAARPDVHAAARSRVAGLPVQEPAAEAERDLSRGHPDPGDLSGPADPAPADREDARPRGDDRLGEELLRRAAARSAALRAQVHARGARRSPLHAARAAPGGVHRDGRHGGRRRRRAAHDDPARQEPDPRGRRTRWRSTRSPHG